MGEKSKDLCPSEKALEKFKAEGPYTFKDALRVASVCDRHANRDGMQAGDAINEVMRSFPPQEFSKLLNPEKHCNPEQLEAWRSGTDDWTYKHLHKGVTDAQIIQIASNRCFEDVMEHQIWSDLTNEARVGVLRLLKRDRIMRQKARHEAKSRGSAAKRDASPVRKNE